MDGGGNAYITGRTNSPDFPTAHPLQATLGGNSNAFVVKLSATGSTLIYSTYLGGRSSGEDADMGNGIATDQVGNTYITGTTSATNFPTYKALQPYSLLSPLRPSGLAPS